jgi:hypothetical protein
MKTLPAILVVLLAAVAPALAQGTFTFANGGSTRITNALTQTPAIGLRVGAYYSPDTNAATTQNPVSLVLAPNTVTNFYAPGLFSGGAQSLAGVATGTFIAMQVRAWTDTYPTYEDALLAAGIDQNLQLGSSRIFLVGPLGGGLSPAATILGLDKLNPIVIVGIPEPGTYALGLLGTALLFFCRRRRTAPSRR